MQTRFLCVHVDFAESSHYTDDSRCATPPTATTTTNISRKHLSKSTSELSCHDYSVDTPSGSPLRTKHGINPSVVGVLQKTHGFFSTLKVRNIRIFVTWHHVECEDMKGQSTMAKAAAASTIKICQPLSGRKTISFKRTLKENTM